jgi:hypothetical protein
MKQYKNTVQRIRNAVNKKIHIIKTPTHKYTHLLQNKLRATTTAQVKTTTVQDIPKLNSHNIIKYPQ